jgi:oligosaccharide translocation protein RFT1
MAQASEIKSREAQQPKNAMNEVKPKIASSVALQICLKGLTFALNNWIARRTDAAYLGIVTVRLEFILTTVGVLAREGVKRALLRSERKDLTAAWISAVFSAVVSLASCALASFSIPEEIGNAGKQFIYYRSLAFYGFASIIEASAEGPLALCLREGLGKERIWAESAALMIKIGVIISLLQSEIVSMAHFIDACARGQLAFAVALSVLYWRLMPAELRKCSWPSPEFSSLSFSLCGQNAFKFLLGQGDMLIVNAFSSLQDQGTFAVVSNYGSLVLRMLFQPLEEASLSFFAREKMSGSSLNHFSRSLKCLVYLALLFSCFASFFTWPVVRFLLGSKWIEQGRAVQALAAYCWFIGSAGISGFLESLVHVIIDDSWMSRSRNWTVIISVVYCALAVSLIRLFQTTGLVAAGAINFAIRSVLSVAIINHYAPRQIWNNSTPRRCVLIAFAGAGVFNAALLKAFGHESWIIRLIPAILSFSLTAFIALKYDFHFFKSLAK